jgi:hypothetical protein
MKLIMSVSIIDSGFTSKLFRVIVIFALFFSLPEQVYSYTNFTKPGSLRPENPMIEDAKDHDMNQVQLRINNTGQIGLDLQIGEGIGFWPEGTFNNYLYGSGLWFGAKFDYDNDGDLDKVFVQAYQPLAAGDTEVSPGSVGQDPEDPLARIFDSNNPADLTEWPEEFRDPGSGEPIVHSLQDYVTIYNDVSGQPIFGETNIGIEVRQRSMAFSHDLSQNVIYVEWDLTNVSESMENGPYTFEDVWIGYTADTDVGVAYADDLVSLIKDFITHRKDTLVIDAAITWDSDFSENNFIGTPGFLGLALIRGPGNDSDGIDNDGDGLTDESPFNGVDDDNDGAVDEPDEVDELGLVNICKYCGVHRPCEVIAPEFDADGYDILSCISEENPDSSSRYHCLESTTPSDIRFMLSTGPFDWLPGQTIRILFAFVFASPVGTINQLEFVGDPPRPDPNDPALADFITTVIEAREFARSGFSGVGIGKGGEFGQTNIPRSFTLSQNYPNPFNPSTTIKYDIPAENGPVRVEIYVYDIRGRLIKKLVDREMEPGKYQVHWDGRDDRGQRMASGVYLYRIEAGDFSLRRKMTLIR